MIHGGDWFVLDKNEGQVEVHEHDKECPGGSRLVLRCHAHDARVIVLGANLVKALERLRDHNKKEG